MPRLEDVARIYEGERRELSTTAAVKRFGASAATASPEKHGASTTTDVSSAGAIAADRFFGS